MLALYTVISLLLVSIDVSAQEAFQIYPVQGIFLSDKVNENKVFLKALSKDDLGNDKVYASGLFIETFRSSFQNAVSTINDKNKYSTFVAYLQIPRVSQYTINKAQNLMDLYLPVTMSLNFANMVTGESLYSYYYTYYSKYETTHKQLSDESLEKADTIAGLYKETYKDLLQKVIQKAKENFHPFSIKTVVKKTWNDAHILDKGNKNGIAKGDVLVDQYGNQISVIYASSDYAVAQELLGSVKRDSAFEKYSNESLDEIKKPRVTLLSGIDKENIKTVPENIIYQLVVNALGKKASFSLVSLDKGFYQVQRSVIESTNLKQAVSQNRELPDYFLRLYFYGPFYVNSPSNKPYVSYDTYTIIACGDFLDRSSRVLYGKCVDEKISDEVFENIRYSSDAREEVLVKNAILKLAEDFTVNIKFKNVELPVTGADKDNVYIKDPFNMVSGGTLMLFHLVDKINGIDEDVYIPTWELSVMDKTGLTITANKNLPVSSKMPEPVSNDKILLTEMVTNNVYNSRALKICNKSIESEGDFSLDNFRRLSYYAISDGVKYPFYDAGDFKASAETLNDSGYGFRKKIQIQEAKTDYCLEPIYKVLKQSETTDKGIKSYKFSLVAGIKVYYKDKIVWKKGLQQDLSVSPPVGFEKPFLAFELSKATYNLLNDVIRSIELR